MSLSTYTFIEQQFGPEWYQVAVLRPTGDVNDMRLLAYPWGWEKGDEGPRPVVTRRGVPKDLSLASLAEYAWYVVDSA